MTNVFEIFVKHSDVALKDMLKSLFMLHLDSRIAESNIAVGALFDSGVDSDTAKSLFFDLLPLLGQQEQLDLLSKIVEDWHSDSDNGAADLIKEYILKNRPITLSTKSDSSIQFIKSISKTENVELLELFLDSSTQSLDTTFSQSWQKKSPSLFSFLIYHQQLGQPSPKYLDALFKKGVVLNEESKEAIFFLFKCIENARVVANHGISVYDVHDNDDIYNVFTSIPNYVVKVLQKALDEQSSSFLSDLQAYSLKRESVDFEKDVFYEPFHDGKLMSACLIDILTREKKIYKANRVNRSTTNLVTFLEKGVGKGWLWGKDKNKLFSSLRKLKKMDLGFAYEKIIQDLSLDCLIDSIRDERDVLTVSKLHDIEPYDMLSKVTDDKAKVVVLTALS